jgi:hypothetical protein
VNTRLALRRISMVTIAAILLSACGSTAVESPSMVASTAPASASPAAPSTASPGTVSPAPTVPASPTPSAGGVVSAGWPYATLWGISDVLFAPDGRVVVVEKGGQPEQIRVVAFAADGSVLDGWPWTPAATGSSSIVGEAALGPDSSVYVAVRVDTGVYPVTWTWTLHRLGSAGTELPGFPVGLSSVTYCGLDVSGDGNAFVACQDSDAASGTTKTVVTSIRPDGSTAAGWPVRLAGAGEMVGFRPDIVGFRPDGALVFGTPEDTTSRITVIGRDGRIVTGWPQVVGKPYDAATVDGDGRVWITTRTLTPAECGPASQTSYTVLGRDGQRVSGWPVAVAGWASDPELGTAGSMYAAAGSDRVVGYSASGKVLPGWPARGVDVTVACYGGSQPVSAGDDGIVVVGDGRATLLATNGRVASGWPVTLPYTVAASCQGCTPGPGGPIDPVAGQRAIYIAAYDHGKPRIIAIDRKGSIPKAWQRSLGTGSGELLWLHIAPTGRVWAAVSRAQGSEKVSTAIYLVAEDSVVGG